MATSPAGGSRPFLQARTSTTARASPANEGSATWRILASGSGGTLPSRPWGLIPTQNTIMSARGVNQGSNEVGEVLRHGCRARCPTQVVRPVCARQELPNSKLEVRGGLRVAEVLKHQTSGQHCGNRVGDALPGNGRCGTVHRLEQAVPRSGMEVGAGGDPEAAYQAGAEIGQDVAVQVVRDDDLEALGFTHELERQRVHVPVLRRDVRVFLRQRLEPILPDAVRRNRVRLVAHGDAAPAVGIRPGVGCANNPLDALAGVHFFRDMLVTRRATAAEVLALGILPENDEVDRPRVAQRREVGMQQLYRTETDVQIQLEP